VNDVNRILSCLAALGTLALPVSAGALPAGVPYQILLGGTKAGTLVFALDAHLAAGACRYAAAWAAGGTVPEDRCYFDEATWLGHESCFENSLGPISSLVVVAPGAPCWGFDTNGQDNAVFLLVLGEHAEDGSLDGVLQFTSASQAVSSFHAGPAP
jgi:hypothetical protein